MELIQPNIISKTAGILIGYSIYTCGKDLSYRTWKRSGFIGKTYTDITLITISLLIGNETTKRVEKLIKGGDKNE